MIKNILLLATIVLLITSCGQSENKNNEKTDLPETVDQPQAMESDLSDHPGLALYKQHCLICHQADGMGVPGMNPPLVDTEWVNGPNDVLIRIVLHGMNEEIEVNGEYYDMPMAGLPHLTDREIVDILNYVRDRFGSSEVKITEEEVSRVRAEG